MPHRRHRGPPKDPLTACLDADGTYICTAYNSRCYIIQKVTPTTAVASLNPDADIFQSKAKPTSDGEVEVWDSTTGDTIAEIPTTDGYVYMNGDVGKLPSGAVYSATPEPLATPASAAAQTPVQTPANAITDYSTLNGIVDPLEGYSDASGAPGSASEPPSAPEMAPAPVAAPPPVAALAPSAGFPLDQLKQMLSTQLEYYFSRENLANDTYLLSQMDNDQYVPIWTVANFNQVKKLTNDIKLITEVLRESPNVQVDEEGQKVRPNHKRCIVILREIPDSTPLEDVKGLFSGKGCPRLISCEFAHNNSWYVTFENDEDAQKAYRFLREEVREFQGKPIMARIKAKTMNRLPIPPVGPSMGPMKNGYRTPPAATVTAPVFDHSASYPATAQRLFYTNGTSLQPSVNYGSQVQIYTFQQHQPFYPPSMLPPWGTNYFELGSVFSVNGLAPTGSFAKAPSSNRYIPRNTRNKRNQMGEHRTMSESGLSRNSSHVQSGGMKTAVKVANESHHNHSVAAVASNVSSVVKPHYVREPVPSAVVDTDTIIHSPPARQPEPSDHQEMYRQPLIPPPKDAMPPRHRRRRKDEEGRPGGSPIPAGGGRDMEPIRGPQFDLEADAFPPLPGLEATAPVPSAPTMSSLVKAAPVETTPVDTSAAAVVSSQLHWENRLSDVVKGTVKVKSGPSSLSSPGCTTIPQAVALANAAAVSAPTNVASVGSFAASAKESAQAAAATTVQSASMTSILPPHSSTSTTPPTPPPPPLPSQPNLPTPPMTPDKTVPVAVIGGKSCTADKSTKTEEMVLTGDGAGGDQSGGGEGAAAESSPPTILLHQQQLPPLPHVQAKQQHLAAHHNPHPLPKAVVQSAPTTSNAATMTDIASTAQPAAVSSQSQGNEGNIVRLSYAQVTQHHKERAERERQQMTSASVIVEEERREPSVSQTREVTSGGGGGPLPSSGGRSAGRGMPRQSSDRGPRRRDNLPRFNSRPRSPK